MVKLRSIFYQKVLPKQVLEQNMDGRWKGSVMSDSRDCRTGYFPHQVVQLLERPVGGSQRTGTIRTATIKKVPPPTVPGITNRCSYTSSSYDSPSVGDVEYGSIHLDKIVSDSQASSGQFDASNTTGMTPSADCQVLEDQGIEIEVSPGRESPGGSSVGCLSRHSTASVDSGRSSIPSTDTKVSQQRIPAQVYDSSQISNYFGSDDCVNVAEMIIHNVPDTEILKSWLIGVHFEEYTPLFLQAGYDMPTVSRMTPEDLTAVGITKPVHRRKLKAEIAKLNISDGIPDYKPDTLLEWLQLLRLEEYHDTLCQQDYNTVDKVADLAWEDLEEIGIQKLGHQKKIMLAIKRIRDINSGIRRPSLNPASQQTGRGAALSRPQTLGPVHPISSYQYHCQEVAITTVKVKTSPSNEICNAPELKTFQQSPTRNDGFKWPVAGEAVSPSHQFEPHMVAIQVRSPNRGHSLENLDSNDSVSVAMPHHSYLNNSDTWYDTVSAWRQHGYDTDSELSIRGDHGCTYETDGTATLHRPKGLVKPRPVAKIVAKSRHSNQVSDIDSVKSQLKCIDHKTEQSTTQGSNQSGIQQTNGSSIYGTLKHKRTPPPPPKRSNSIKSDPSIERSIEAMKDEAFATCVKGLASHFNISTKTSDSQPDHNQERTFSPAPEEFPPPPSPLPSATSESYTKLSNVPAPVRNDSEQNDVPELFSNAMFRQRRKHSVDSSASLSNTESNTMPFANENVSTIKQKVVKPQASLQDTKSQSSSPSVLRKTNLILPGNKPLSAKRRNSAGGDRSEDTGFTRKVAGAAEDVIDDIEHMLTNLSNQLDAMLEDEQLMKET